MKQTFPILIDRRAWPGTVILLAITFLSLLFIPAKGAALLFFVFTLFHLAFFRDPFREMPAQGFLSPADGKVVEIEQVFENRFLKAEAIKIGIFLSIFDVHVTKTPIAGTIQYLHYQPGQFLNALRKESAQKNESNWIGIDDQGKRILVRQIAGGIARKIHWDVRSGQKVERGEKIGIICYGSRVECFFPKPLYQLQIKVGSSVKAGETVLAQ